VVGRLVWVQPFSKKSAQTACYLDVTQYLESCDKDLWKTFVEAAKSGKDLGMAPTVYFAMSSGLDDEIRDLCRDIRKSSLFKNRPATKISANLAGSNASNVQTRSFNAPKRSEAALAAKSDRLLKRRQEYLENPDMEHMRSSRMLLPVCTRAAELIRHIENHEVAICVAATGSGKTTQIPQLIFDDWIQREKGAHCNIVCTQPRGLPLSVLQIV
jgi:small subunit ribosomal protein S24e